MKKSHGYTLLEAVMVIVIVVILSAFTYVRFPSPTSFNLNSIAEQLKAGIRLAQTQAMSVTNTTASITINTNSYQVSGNSLVTLPSGVTLSPAQTITFSAYGAPGAATTVTVTVSGTSRTLTINGVTGYVSG